MGFSAEWLALREPADHAARDHDLLRAAAQAAGARPVIVDLGSGTGSTLRAFGPVLGTGAQWRLVDSDPALLDVAGQQHGQLVSRHVIDLRQLDDLPLDGATLVTASALLDLCSEAWVTHLAARLAAQGVAFYAALNYDGVMAWSPTHPEDAVITAAFNRHQRGDKGFGPALGPDCAQVAAAVFRAAGFTVTEADSPWQLDRTHAQMHQHLCTGIAAAAAEMGAAQTGLWAARRQQALADGHCHIGHRDLLAVPPPRPAQSQRQE